MEYSVPQMLISMPLVTSELFFSSTKELGHTDESCGGQQTPRERAAPQEPLQREDQCDSPLRSASRLDDEGSDIYVVLSRELAAIEGTEALSVLNSAPGDAGQMPPRDSTVSPKSSPRNGFLSSEGERPGKLSSASSWMKRLYQVGHLPAQWSLQ